VCEWYVALGVCVSVRCVRSVGLCVCVYLCVVCVCVWNVGVFFLYLLHSMLHYTVILHALYNLSFN